MLWFYKYHLNSVWKIEWEIDAKNTASELRDIFHVRAEVLNFRALIVVMLNGEDVLLIFVFRGNEN